MKKLNFFKVAIFCFLFSMSFSSLAWEHGISLGYGGGSDINHHTDTNTGAFLSAEFTSIKQNDWINITLNGSLVDSNIGTMPVKS